MKAISLVIALVLSTATGFAQTHERDAVYYRELSKKQAKTGLIVLGAGAATAGIGLAIASGSYPGEFGFGAGIGLVAAGGIASLMSIIYFVMAIDNAGRAKKMSVQIENAPLVQNNGKPLYYPSVGIKLPLRFRR